MGKHTQHKNGNGSLVSAALIVGVSSLLSRVIGLLRERVFTTTFGAGDTFDAFVAAFRIPDLIFNLIVIGALSAAFIPLFTEKLVKGKKGEKEAFRFSVSIFNMMVMAVGFFSLMYAMAAPYIVPLITPGFEGEKLEMTIQLSRIMALQPILLAVSFVFSGVLNSFKRFAVYALAPILYNLGIIFGVWVLVPAMGISGLGWGVVLGAALHLLVQLPSVLLVGFRWRPILVSSVKDIRQLWGMMVPRVFGLAAQQINLLVVTIFGSSLLSGSITAFHLANNIQHIPIGIFGIAFSQAAFPTLAEQVARKQTKQFRNTVTRTFRYILFFVIPISVFFYLLRAQIVRVLFGDGAFGWSDTVMTFQTFGLLTISIFAQATIPLLTKAFYAHQNTVIPVATAIANMAVNLVLAIYLTPIYGIFGLALAFSGSAIVQLLLLVFLLRYKLHGIDEKSIVRSASKMVIAAFVGGSITQLLKYLIDKVVDMHTFLGVMTQLSVSFAAGVAVYLALCWFLRCEEIVAIKKYMPRKLRLTAGSDTPRFSGLPE